MTATESLLSLSGGTVELDGTPVLSDVDFVLRRGEFTVLLGANGSGKTTLVKSLIGLVPVARGDVTLFGQPLARFKRWDRLGYVPQRVTASSGVPASVAEVVLSGRATAKTLYRRFQRADRDAAAGALEAVDLADLARKPVSSLSGGQQQRVLIARALARQPEVLLLDEPVASVDLAHQETFARVLTDLRRAGTSILLVAHALGAMAPLVDRAVVLERGDVVYDGAPRSLPRLEDHHHHHHHDESEPDVEGPSL
ncbi:MAG: metal ABC transporter ATP-binding protein [Actinomycetota bacterium]